MTIKIHPIYGVREAFPKLEGSLQGRTVVPYELRGTEALTKTVKAAIERPSTPPLLDFSLRESSSADEAVNRCHPEHIRALRILDLVTRAAVVAGIDRPEELTQNVRKTKQRVIDSKPIVEQFAISLKEGDALFYAHRLLLKLRLERRLSDEQFKVLFEKLKPFLPHFVDLASMKLWQDLDLRTFSRFINLRAAALFPEDCFLLVALADVTGGNENRMEALQHFAENESLPVAQRLWAISHIPEEKRTDSMKQFLDQIEPEKSNEEKVDELIRDIADRLENDEPIDYCLNLLIQECSKTRLFYEQHLPSRLTPYLILINSAFFEVRDGTKIALQMVLHLTKKFPVELRDQLYEQIIQIGSNVIEQSETDSYSENLLAELRKVSAKINNPNTKASVEKRLKDLEPASIEMVEPEPPFVEPIAPEGSSVAPLELSEGVKRGRENPKIDQYHKIIKSVTDALETFSAIFEKSRVGGAAVLANQAREEMGVDAPYIAIAKLILRDCSSDRWLDEMGSLNQLRDKTDYPDSLFWFAMLFGVYWEKETIEDEEKEALLLSLIAPLTNLITDLGVRENIEFLESFDWPSDRPAKRRAVSPSYDAFPLADDSSLWR